MGMLVADEYSCLYHMFVKGKERTVPCLGSNDRTTLTAHQTIQNIPQNSNLSDYLNVFVGITEYMCENGMR